jgi:flagellar hook-associated protein 3 FlgL
MRITQGITYRNFLASVENLNQSLEAASRQVASGKKVTRLRDSPSGSAELVLLKSQLANIDQYKTNVDNSSFFLNVADSALSSAYNLVTTIFTKGSAAASGTTDAAGRATLSNEIKLLRDELLSLANTQTRGRYIFAGSEVKDQAFTMAAGVVTYHGNMDVNKLEIGNSLEVEGNIPGSSIFLPVFRAVTDLVQAIDSGDSTAIETALTGISPVMADVSKARVQIGVDLRKLEEVKIDHDAQQLNIKTRQGNIEDADMAEAITELNQIQSALKAALTAQSTIQQYNLFDFLG